MNKAGQRALEAYPRDEDRELNYRRANYRIAYERGYNQAEKDLALTWEDIKEIQRLLDVVWSEQDITAPIDEDTIYKEALKRFNEARK